MIIIMIIIQEISIAHNPELKAWAQCTHRKKEKKGKINYLYENKNKKKTKHTITTTQWTIVQPARKRKRSNSRKGGQP